MTMKSTVDSDLGFSFHVSSNGDIDIRHQGKHATKIRGAKARQTHEKLDRSSFEEQQQLMARLTGNYKRGNEKLAKNHSRRVK